MNKLNSSIIIFLLANTFIKAQVTDVHGHTYNTVQIGVQEWMTENLKATSFQDGTEIAFAANDKEWEEMTENKIPCWTYYLYDIQYADRGLFYNFYAAHSPKGLASEGWKVPDAEDWNNLMFFVGAYEDAGKKLKSKEGWGDGNGTDEYGFNACSNGYLKDCGEFTTDYKTVHYWRIDPEYEEDESFGVGQSFSEKDKASFSYAFVDSGMYIRLVKE